MWEKMTMMMNWVIFLGLGNGVDGWWWVRVQKGGLGTFSSCVAISDGGVRDVGV